MYRVIAYNTTRIGRNLFTNADLILKRRVFTELSRKAKHGCEWVIFIGWSRVPSRGRGREIPTGWSRATRHKHGSNRVCQP